MGNRYTLYTLYMGNLKILRNYILDNSIWGREYWSILLICLIDQDLAYNRDLTSLEDVIATDKIDVEISQDYVGVYEHRRGRFTKQLVFGGTHLRVQCHYTGMCVSSKTK